MRRYFRLFNSFGSYTRIDPAIPYSISLKMSTASVALYASTIASSQLLGAKPEEADDKKHHLQNSKGFQNPWDSYISRAGPTIAWMMIK